MADNVTDAELKPCPFCGGEAVHWPAGSLVDEGVYNELAGCYGTNPNANHIFLRMTLKAWNTRTQSVEEANRELVEASETFALAANDLLCSYSLALSEKAIPITPQIDQERVRYEAAHATLTKYQSKATNKDREHDTD